MTLTQQLITIFLCSLATVLMRLLPFAVFSSDKETPEYIRYLGTALPSAIFAMLVVYCLKDVDLLRGSHGLPELLAVAVTVSLHLWKRKTLLSIAVGTLAYMLLLHFVF